MLQVDDLSGELVPWAAPRLRERTRWQCRGVYGIGPSSISSVWSLGLSMRAVRKDLAVQESGDAREDLCNGR